MLEYTVACSCTGLLQAPRSAVVLSGREASVLFSFSSTSDSYNLSGTSPTISPEPWGKDIMKSHLRVSTIQIIILRILTSFECLH